MPIPFSPSPLCPQCNEKLGFSPDSAYCAKGHVYPMILGSILDLLKGEQNSQSAEELGIIKHLLSSFSQTTFVELNEIFFQHIASVPENLLAHFKKYFANTLERNYRMAWQFRNQARKYYTEEGNALALEVGCGAGGNLIMLSKLYDRVVGIEPRLASLILAQKLLDEQGVSNVLLIRGYAQKIPYSPSSFDYVTAINVLEHVLNIEAVTRELYRILSPGGIFIADSRNRFDLFFAEPHVKIRFVGFFPREWAKKYVLWRTGLTYDQTRLWSYFDLKKVLKQYFKQNHKILFVPASAYNHSRKIDFLLDLINEIPILFTSVLLIYPSHLIIAQKHEVAHLESGRGEQA